ncbi:MAG TPA: hypothetical protein VMJ93_00820 [Verrucomicrobiae bacterium]|nr:hypothetical protein [Verrucomicrobiae bacterium]
MNTAHSDDQTGSWVMYLAIFSIGADGLAFLIFVQDRSAALFAIPALLAWQVVFIAYFSRHILPTYRRLPEEHPGDHAMYLFLFRLATVAPAVWAIAAWTVISVLSPGHH